MVEALWGAAGFVGAKMVPSLLPIPVQLKVGPMRYVTGAVTAWGLGQVAGKFVNKRVGDAIFVGGMIAVAVDVVQEVVLPMLPAAGGGAAAPAAAAVSGYLSRGSINGRLPWGVEETAGAY